MVRRRDELLHVALAVAKNGLALGTRLDERLCRIFHALEKIRIKLKSYDHNLVDKSAEKIVRTVKATGAIVSGPIPLPTHKRIFTVNRSTFVNKKSREQFELSSYKRLIDIYSSTAKTVDALMKLELPSGVEVEIKV